MLEQAVIVTQRCVEGVEPHGDCHWSSMTRDGDLAVAAQICLRASRYRGVQSLWCECRCGVLVLHGQVSSYYQKQLAQECLRSVYGVRRIENRVDVV